MLDKTSLQSDNWAKRQGSSITQKKRGESMMKKRGFLFLATCIILGSLSCPAHAQGGGNQAAGMKSLKIGVISPQTGPIAFYGLSVVRGVDVDLKAINERGTLGKG